MSGSGGPVERLLGSAVRAGVAPGGVAVWGQGRDRLRSVAVGQARLRPEMKRTDLDVWYDLASLTKPLVVTSIALTAFRRDELTLSTTAGEVLAELAATPLSKVSVEQLLSHTSGLPAWLPLYAMSSTPSTTPLETLGRVDLEAEPGNRALYSCLDFVLLGLMIERVSESRLDSVFESRVVAPLGLAQEIGFQPNTRPSIVLAGGAAQPTAEHRQTAELGLDPSVVPVREPGFPDDGNARFLGGVAGNAGLFGTARGVWSLAAEYLPGGSVLSHSDIELATRASASACRIDPSVTPVSPEPPCG